MCMAVRGDSGAAAHDGRCQEAGADGVGVGSSGVATMDGRKIAIGYGGGRDGDASGRSVSMPVMVGEATPDRRWKEATVGEACVLAVEECGWW